MIEQVAKQKSFIYKNSLIENAVQCNTNRDLSLKSAKPQHFREFVIKLNIWTKNKDFDSYWGDKAVLPLGAT